MSNVARLTAAKQSAMPLAIISGDLEEVERHFQKALDPFRPRFGHLVNHLRHYRGKRLRPALVLLSAQACGRVTPAHHVLGAVVEMIHTATLVHDDVLDEADLRRHVKTINSGWDNKTSILLGDMLLSAAFRLCASVDARACEWVGDATNRVCAGELLQVSNAGNHRLDEATYFEIVAGKTGALTEVCTRLGAHYAGAQAATVDGFASYGQHLGIAFQIADDVLDLTGQPEMVGKTLGTDIAQGKLTLPMIRMRDALNGAELADVEAAFAAADAATIVRMIDRTGALESARQEGELQIRTAIEGLQTTPRTPFHVALEQIAMWSMTRDR
jgi:octaprenyl-diphosphate synthase